MGKRLMIIELGKLQLAEELLIETRTQVTGHVCYQDGEPRVSVTSSCPHGGEGDGM